MQSIFNILTLCVPVSQPPKDNFGDLLGNMGMPAPVQPVPVANGDNKVEVEDQSQGMYRLVSQYVYTIM